MQCEMCGKEDFLVRAKIEGTEMKVCKNCSKYGEVMQERIVKKIEMPKPRAREEPSEFVVPEYANLIKNARASKGLNQEEFAKILNIKESMIHNMESDKQKPDIELARKLEKALHIKLVETFKEEKMESGKTRNDGFTLGDFIKKK
jgi:putative transcription factor